MIERVGRHTHLFQEIDFVGHSGDQLHWKIEMDALDDKEWKCIARMIAERSLPFRQAIGIPRGGVKLGEFLNEYSTNSMEHPICIVDDVLTTGGSFNFFLDQYIRNRRPEPYMGWVVFARSQPPDWVNSLFQMPERINNEEYKGEKRT